MTRKKAPAPEQANGQPAAGEKSVRLYLAAADHRTLRQLAARAELPMSAFVRRLVESEIRREGQ